MERISRIYGIQIKSLFVSLFLILSTIGYSQADCAGVPNTVVNPLPIGSGGSNTTTTQMNQTNESYQSIQIN